MCIGGGGDGRGHAAHLCLFVVIVISSAAVTASEAPPKAELASKAPEVAAQASDSSQNALLASELDAKKPLEATGRPAYMDSSTQASLVTVRLSMLSKNVGYDGDDGHLVALKGEEMHLTLYGSHLTTKTKVGKVCDHS